MRGTQRVRAALACDGGIIPAHAGNTSAGMSAMSVSEDHPRACGEHASCWLAVETLLGSSPRMRGTRGRTPFPARIQGIIPAHAGNTPIDSGEMLNARDHPRACGEHSVFKKRQFQKPGSSPRMRGTQIRQPVDVRLAGIIPAHAGNTSTPCARPRPRRDHPRACGEHVFHIGFSREKHGIIPAHAGNTEGVTALTRLCGDHPRACGEHWRNQAYGPNHSGSSPRMRGTHPSRPCRVHSSGIIPAHAGNTPC